MRSYRFWGIGIRQNRGRDAVLGKKTVFGIQARDGRDAGLS